MTDGRSPCTWYSPVGALVALFIAEKQACGYGYVAERALLGRFDRFLAGQGLREPALPRDLVEQWVAKRPQESPGTQRLRFGLTRHFATFLTHPATRPTSPMPIGCPSVGRALYPTSSPMRSAASSRRPNAAVPRL